MKLMKFPALSILCLTVLLWTSSITSAAGIERGSVTIYNSGRALVTETRSVTLPKGVASVVFRDVPETIDPTSVRASAPGMRVSGIEYRYVPITRKISWTGTWARNSP